MSAFSKATRKRSYLKLGITGPSGSVKTYSALRLATGLSDGKPIAFLDTENGSASLYSESFDFDVMDIHPPFTEAKIIEGLEAAVSEKYEVVVIDSYSHFWEGALEFKATLDAKGGNSYTNWNFAGKKFRGTLDAILQSSCHIICCMRSKMDYVLEADLKGKQAPRKVGLAPIMRDGIEYEFTTVFDGNTDHYVTTSKDRTGLFVDQHFQITEDTGSQLLDWLNTAVPEEPKQTLQEKLAMALVDIDNDDVHAFLVSRKVSDSVLTVPDEYAERSLRRLPELKAAINKFRQDTLRTSELHNSEISDALSKLQSKMGENKVTDSELISVLVDRSMDVGDAEKQEKISSLPIETVKVATKQWPTLYFSINSKRKLSSGG